MIIKTQRLALRKLREEDFEQLGKMLQDDEVMYAYEGAFDDEEVREWIRRQIARYEEDGIGLYAVILRTTGELIGQCGLTMQTYNESRVMEVGYLFCKEFWHKGYAIEAAKACRDYAFRELGAKEVYSIIRVSNIASLNVAKRNDMTIIDTIIKHFRGLDMPHYVCRVKK